MLLDFHLAQQPLRPEGPAPEWLGGTLQYMSPEQQAALASVRDGKPVPQIIDGRSDIYSLGLVLYEALGGSGSSRFPGPLSAVSVGLSDIIMKCLSPAVGNRYATAAALAGDLRRHLANQPLQGVANRSWPERWRKWRRRKPSALYFAVLSGLLLLLVGVGGGLYLNHIGQIRREAQADLAEGQQQFGQGDYAEAVRAFSRGLERINRLPQNRDLAETLNQRLRTARHAQAVRDLHGLVDRLRFPDGAESLPQDTSRNLILNCQSVWDARGLLLDGSWTEPAQAEVRTDFLDLALLWTGLRTRLASKKEMNNVRRDALRILEEAEAIAGPTAALLRERYEHAAALGLVETAQLAQRRAAELTPRTAWEHHALGRSLFHSGQFDAAAVEFDRALHLQPQAFWPNFHRGLCAFRLKKYEEAVNDFRVCIALMPQSADCFYNRALAYAALEQIDQAIHDYDRALQLDPSLAAAYLNRGVLFGKTKHYSQAILDLRTSMEKGADPATVYFNQAIVHEAQAERATALSCLRRALQYRSDYREARELLEQLQKQDAGPRKIP
jgi:tetratricopeptide (TPR) repeat protein